MAEISGCLFPNERGPAFKGFIEIDGVRHQVVCWNRESKKDGKPFLGVSADQPRDGERRPPPRPGASAYARGPHDPAFKADRAQRDDRRNDFHNDDPPF